MSFTFACSGVPGHRGGKRHLSSLASKVNQAVASFPTMSVSPVVNKLKPPKRRTQSDDIAARVSGKLEEGDIRGAIRLAASDDIMSPFDDVAAAALREKHPVRARTGSTPLPPSSETCLSVLESDILGAIKSFMPGSAGGPDSLRPQHLKDLTCASTGDAGRRLLTLLTQFSNLCLAGRVPAEIQPVFCGYGRTAAFARSRSAAHCVVSLQRLHARR